MLGSRLHGDFLLGRMINADDAKTHASGCRLDSKMAKTTTATGENHKVTGLGVGLTKSAKYGDSCAEPSSLSVS
jgi:hypothetical protein